MSKQLNGSKTHQNLKDAFAGESQANRRYLYFAQVADIEGLPEIAGNFKETADGETGHAHGHLKYLAAGRRPGDGPADRQHGEEPQGRDRRRDARVRDDVPGHGEERPRRGLRRHRRVVRDAREGREEPRGSLPEDARHAQVTQRASRRRRRGAPHQARGVAVSLSQRDTPWPRSIRSPQQPPAFNPNDPRYWDERDLEGELKRVFEICHSCRMCVNYCGSFPDLFARVDRDIETKQAPTAPSCLDVERLHVRHRPLLAVQALLHQVPVHAGRGARVDARLPSPR